MRTKILIFFGIILFLFVIFGILINKTKNKSQLPTPIIKITPTKIQPINKTSIFVPYWSDWKQGEGFDRYDRVIYFGIDVAKTGVTNNNSRLKDIEDFSRAVQGKDKLLTVVMTDTDTNLAVLQNPDAWEEIYADSIKIAQENGFQGLVLDLEMSVIPFDRIVNQIADFNKLFYQKTKENNLYYAVLLYGDTIYRKRPYYLPLINQYSDEIMVMAYDFHKSRGEPGPNFPFKATDEYGYDFQRMTTDYLKEVPAQKLTVIFGMFGYDWMVDEKKRPYSQAKSMSLNEIKKEFLENCPWQDCIIRKDKLTKETEINYVKSQLTSDNFANLYLHIVWFENEESATVKAKYLKDQGVGSVGYWAYSYF